MITDAVVGPVDSRKAGLLHRGVHGAISLFLIGRVKFYANDKCGHINGWDGAIRLFGSCEEMRSSRVPHAKRGRSQKRVLRGPNSLPEGNLTQAILFRRLCAPLCAETCSASFFATRMSHANLMLWRCSLSFYSGGRSAGCISPDISHS